MTLFVKPLSLEYCPKIVLRRPLLAGRLALNTGSKLMRVEQEHQGLIGLAPAELADRAGFPFTEDASSGLDRAGLQFLHGFNRVHRHGDQPAARAARVFRRLHDQRDLALQLSEQVSEAREVLEQ